MVRALRHRNFRWFWISAAGQAVAQGMQTLILGWLVLELTSSATQLGLVVFLYGIPNLSFVMFGGIFADRIDRRKLLVGSQAAVTVVIFALATLTITHLVVVWQVYVASFILGTLQALKMPARMAIVADLVEREDIMNAVVLNSAVMSTGRIIGPALAGGIIELTGIGPALHLNASFYFISTVCLFLISGMLQQKVTEKTAVLQDILAGLRYCWSTPVVFTVIGIGFAFGFFGMPYVQVMPAFAKEVLDAGAGGAGLLLTAASIGSLLGNLALAALGNSSHKNWLLLGSILTFGVGLFLFALSPWFWLSWTILLLVGIGSMVPLGTTVLQLTVPSEMQGRVLSLWYVSAALMSIGSLPMAVVADTFGWRIAIGGGAALYLLVALWLGVWRPTLRHLKV
jgi:MFS family permease